MNDESEDKWLPLKRAADQKALILAAVSAIIFVAGISGSGIFRWGKFDTDDASVLKASVIRYMDLNFVRKEEYREKHNVMKSRMNATENDDEKLFLDIRSLYNLVATVDAEHPPAKLKQSIENNRLAISKLDLRLQILEKENSWWHKMGQLEGFK